MTIALNDILEVQYNFTQQGVEGKMIQFCRLTSLPSQPQPYIEEEFARSLFAKVSTVWASIISSSSSFLNVYVRNRTNDLYEGYSNQAAVVGTGGTVSPPFVAIGIFQSRATTATRNGYKRFPFPSEARTSGNVLNLTAAQIAMIQEVFGASFVLEDPEAFYDDVNVQNVIIPRVLGGVPPIYTPNYAAPNLILQAIANRVTTQNTRKT